MGSVSGVISLAALIGYAFAADALYSVHFFNGIAVHTGFALLILSIGVLLARSQDGFVSVVSRDDACGALVRILGPIALVMPTFGGWVRWEAQKAGLIGTALGIIVFALYNTLCLIAFIYVGVLLLDRLVRQAGAVEV